MKFFLIVASNKNLRSSCQEILRKNFNCSSVDHALNRVEAFNHVESVDYDVIIADIDMPDMDGMEFYEQLKKEHPLIAKRVAFISGRLESFYLTFLTREKHPWIAKPFDDKDFLSLVNKVLNHSDSEKCENKRGYGRLVKSVGCACAPANLDCRTSGLSATTIDFSRGGLSIVYKGEKLSTGTKLHTTIECFGLSNVMAITVWSDKRGRDVYISGLK